MRSEFVFKESDGPAVRGRGEAKKKYCDNTLSINLDVKYRLC